MYFPVSWLRAKMSPPSVGESAISWTWPWAGIPTLARGYCTRTMIGLLEKERGPEVWDPLHMDRLVGILPDERRHLQALSGLSARDVRRRFAMSPLRVSAEACCWGRVPDSHLEVLNQVSDKDIMNAVSAPWMEPMASSLAAVAARGRVWHPVPGPVVWVRRLKEEWLPE